MTFTKQGLWEAGVAIAMRFCERNAINQPRFRDANAFGNFGCYDHGTIIVDVNRCALPIDNPRVWSYPGYKADRTPYGVVAHELGHHWHCLYGYRVGIREWKAEVVGEPKLTSYEPNTSEAIAESFKVYVTNPTLLQELRPQRFAFFEARLQPVETRGWREILAGSPRHKMAVLRATL